MIHRIALATALAVVAAPALSASVAEISGSFTLGAQSDPGGVVIALTGDRIETFDEATGLIADARATASGTAVAGLGELDVGRLDAVATADTTGGVMGSALAGGLVDLGLLVQNTSQELKTIVGVLEYSLQASLDLDEAGDDGSASIFLDIIAFRGTDFETVLFSDGLDLDAASQGVATTSSQAPIEIPLPLPGGFAAPVSIVLGGSASVDDVSPVPLPAGLPLLGAGLLGLAAMRRRPG